MVVEGSLNNERNNINSNVKAAKLQDFITLCGWDSESKKPLPSIGLLIKVSLCPHKVL